MFGPGCISIDYAGEKIRDGGDWCFGIVCDLCGKRETHHARNIRRGLPPTFQVAKMMECWLVCPRQDELGRRPAGCEAEWVTVEDGCSEEG